MSNTDIHSIDLNNLVTLDENRVKEIFDHDYQNKFIKVFLTDVDFFSNVFDIIVLKYFDDYQKLLLDAILKFYAKNHAVPDFEDLKRYIRTIEKNDLRKDQLIGLIDRIKNDTIVKSEKDIKDTALIFFKKRALANALYEMASLWDKDNFEGMAAPLTNALKAGEKKQSGLDYEKDIDSTLDDDIRNVIKIMEGIDEEIDGGVAAGEFVVILAPTGGGKSMVLVAMAANALTQGKKVLYISLELGKKYIAKRFHACFNKINLKELKYFPDAIKEKTKEIFSIPNSKLKIEYFPTRRLTVPKLKSYIESLERTEGFKPDILFLDYADIMNASGYDKEHRLALQILYQDLRGMSGELGIPCISASQTNRSSAKLERITIENVAESWAKLAEADLVLGIGRGETAEKDQYNQPITLKQLNKATVGFLKNRMGSDGFYKMFNLNTANVSMDIEKKDQVSIPNNLVKNNEKNNIKNFTDRDSKESINEILAKQIQKQL